MKINATRSKSLAGFGNALRIIAIILLIVGVFATIIGGIFASESKGEPAIAMFIGLGLLVIALPTFLWSNVISGLSHIVRASEVYYQEKGFESPEDI